MRQLGPPHWPIRLELAVRLHDFLGVNLYLALYC